MTSGLITNIQKYALEDGPGIRTTVFLKGCPLACAWCHNPENISRQPEIIILESRCVRCGRCLLACPHTPENIAPPNPGSVAPDNLRAPADCHLCGACADACPTGARILMGREYSRDELLDELLADRPFFEESGGGLTLSGGEPMAQFGFIHELLTAAKAEGIHTALDTCGFAPTHQLLKLLPLVSLFLYDLKFLDDDRHREFTGVSNSLILDNLRTLDTHHAFLWLRIPVVPGVNDDPAELESLAQFAAELKSVRQVNLLPYHRTALVKFQRLYRPYSLNATAAPSTEMMARAAAPFERLGLPTRIGG
jgi:pyruvate formate lyase activating enzyme